MASRLRQSTAISATPRPGRQSTAGPTPNRRGQQQQQQSSQPQAARGAELPEYQPPAHPLNTAGRDALKNLTTNRRIALFDQRMTIAIACLSENATALNDTVYDKALVVEKDRKRHGKEAPEDDDDERRVRKLESDLETMQEKVDTMTQRMDQDLRKMIDTREYFNSIRPVLEEITNEATTFARSNATSTQPTTQQTRSQRRAARNNDEDDDDSDSGDEYHDFTPTDPTNAQTQSTQQPPATITLFRDKLERRRDRYQNQSYRARYAQDNDYRQFRKVLHDARYGDDAPPMPHESTWFTDSGVANLPKPGVTDMAATIAQRQDAEDSDDDLQIAKETISTKCPLTLREFVDPVTSRKCPHSFEKEAIFGMIDNPSNTMNVGGSNTRGARDGKRAVTCPVSGCGSVLTKDDLHTDPLLIRKIKRIQRAEREAEEEEEEDYGNENKSGQQAGGRDRPQEIESGGSSDLDEEIDVDDIEREERQQAAKRIKLERFSGRVSRGL